MQPNRLKEPRKLVELKTFTSKIKTVSFRQVLWLNTVCLNLFRWYSSTTNYGTLNQSPLSLLWQRCIWKLSQQKLDLYCSGFDTHSMPACRLSVVNPPTEVGLTASLVESQLLILLNLENRGLLVVLFLKMYLSFTFKCIFLENFVSVIEFLVFTDSFIVH